MRFLLLAAFSVVLHAGNLDVFDAVWNKVRRHHIDASNRESQWEFLRNEYRPKAEVATSERQLYNVINAMLARLGDSHTSARTPTAVRQEKLRIANRLGFTARFREGRWVLQQVEPESDLLAAGAGPGWILAAVDGQPLPARADALGGFYQQIRLREKCDGGQELALHLISPAEEEKELALKCKVFATTPKQEVRKLEAGAVYVRFDEFATATASWLRQQLQPYDPSTPMVLDLRQNHGGLVHILFDILPMFYEKEVDAGRTISRGGRQKERRLKGTGRSAWLGPVAVLTDAQTASCAEIMAAILQETGRAKIFGAPSAGAVMMAIEDRLPDGGELQISVWNYETPRGHRLEGPGVKPDVPIEPRLTDLRSGRDPALQAALSAIAEHP